MTTLGCGALRDNDPKPSPIKHLLAPPRPGIGDHARATGTLVQLPTSCAVQAWLKVPPSHEKHRVDLLSLSNARQARPQTETLSRTGCSDVKGFSVPADLLPASIPAREAKSPSRVRRGIASSLNVLQIPQRNIQRDRYVFRHACLR